MAARGSSSIAFSRCENIAHKRHVPFPSRGCKRRLADLVLPEIDGWLISFEESARDIE